MQYLLELVQLSARITLLDVDNALYMTSAIEPLPKEEQKKAIFWGLLLEYAARIILVLIFGYLVSGTEPLFEIFGIEFTAVTLPLLAAGIFLIVHSTRELFNFFFGSNESQPKNDQDQAKSFNRLLAEMTLVNILMSVGTAFAIVVGASTSGAQFVLVFYMLTFSAGVRLLFVQQIAGLIQRYPATNIIILVFLTIIGIELSAQGLGLVVPEMLFNGMLLIALFAALVYQIRFTKSARAT